MRTKLFLLCTVFLAFSPLAQAKGGGGILRGGQGFLFPDHNSFANPGQFALDNGTAIEGFYSRSTATTPTQNLIPSMVYGNGMVGLGVYGEHSGTDALSGGTNKIGAGVGFSLLKDHLTVGAKYVHTLGTTGAGDLSATMTLNPAGRHGFALGVGYTRQLAASTHGVNAAVGYTFSGNNNVELDVDFPSLTSFSQYNLAAHFTMMKQMIYFGGGYLLNNTTGTMLHGATGRLGFLLGGAADFSVWGRYIFTAGSVVDYGGSFRVAF
ncbi:hypothetical protein K2X33_15185 [bacterium]|nr:hypothetical protein [bacterium]